MSKDSFVWAITDPEYKNWIRSIETRFRQQQIKAAIHVNSDKIEFYWSLGCDICEMQIEKRYGDAAIKVLSKDLQNVIPEAKGLTPVNLYYCKRFYLLYNHLFKKVPQVVEKSLVEGNSATKITEAEKIPQVVELFKLLHSVTALMGILPLNIFAIPWGHHRTIIDYFENEPQKALFPPHISQLPFISVTIQLAST